MSPETSARRIAIVTPVYNDWESFAVLADKISAVAAANGADADAGRRLTAWAREAGFTDLRPAGTGVMFRDAAAVQHWGRPWAERTLHSNVGRHAVEYGLATAVELEAIADGWRAWCRHPEAFFMYVNVELLARAPAGS